MTMNSIAERRELKRKFATRERVFGGWVSYRDAAIAKLSQKRVWILWQSIWNIRP